MKFLLLKTLLIRRGKDEGFTLPIVIAIGLMMILLSAVNLARSSEENLNTLSQQGLSNAIAMAETGVIRYRELLDKNRVLAVYNLSEWTTKDFVTDQVCDVISESNDGWANNDYDGNESNPGFNPEDYWRTIEIDRNGDGTDETIGYFKVVNYIYDRDGDLTTNNNNQFSQLSDIDDPMDTIANPFDATRNNHNDVDNNGESDARGILTVKGRSLDGSEAQIQVEIPIGVNIQEMDNLSPALWIQQNNDNITSVGNSDTLTIGGGGNVVLYRPSGSGDCDNTTITALDSESTISDPRELPPLIDLTGLNVELIASDITADADFNRYAGYEDGDQALILGTNTTRHDNAKNMEPNVQGENETRYYYKTSGNNLDIGYGKRLLTDSDSKVVVYVNNDLNIGADGVDGNITIGSASGDAASSRFLEIHVAGNVNIKGTGNIDIRALIHAPNGTVNITDSATVTVNGSIWANNWNNTSGTVTITPDDYQYYRITRERTPSPITYRITDWERQDVN